MKYFTLQIAQKLFSTAMDRTGEYNLPICSFKIEKTDSLQEIADKIDYLMVERMPFLDSELTINKVAMLIGTNRTYVSRAVAQKKEMNFATYVNKARLRYANKIAIEKKQVTLCQLSELSGFKSERNFYRILKECNLTGVEFLKKRYICEKLLK